MKPLQTLVAAVVVGMALAAIPSAADAHGRSRSSVHMSFGFAGPGYWGGWGSGWGYGYRGYPGYWRGGYWGAGYWGAPYWGAWGAPYWGPSAVVVIPSEPHVYVERDPAREQAAPPPAAAAPAAPNAPQWWYWCASARQYYPYVASCNEGWQRVTPQPVQGSQ